MGQNHRLLEDRESWEQQVHGALVDAGALSECELHPGIYVDEMSSDAAEEAVQALIENDSEHSEIEIRSAVKARVDDHWYECVQCANNAADD